jgi:flavin reductase (DIM6/NTAB) family NADH-FMN oxidoreductase RutF
MPIPPLKKKFGSKPYLYPQPAVVVGALMNGKPTFTAISFIGVANYAPAIITFGLGKSHYISAGIKENKTFSVNILSEDQLKELDYAGLVSGKKKDKTDLFSTFYGDLQTAPLAIEAPVSLECKVRQVIDLGKNDLIIGEVVETYADEKVISEGTPDIEKIKPISLSVSDNTYWGLGKKIGKAWEVGRELV